MTPDASAPARVARMIPVLDVMNGEVVRAVGGRREQYQAAPSRLTDSARPADVADALLKVTGGNELYVADIDALEGHRPALGWVRDLTGRGVKVLVDAGVRRAADAKAVAEIGAAVIVGSETLATLGDLTVLVERYGPERVLLSVDLRNNRVLGDEAVWGREPDPLTLIEQGRAAGVRRFIVLELARVGTGIGPGTVGLCGRVRAAFPDIELIAGGGVRNWDDVDRLGSAGADAVLVASALHDGTISGPRG